MAQTTSMAYRSNQALGKWLQELETAADDDQDTLSPPPGEEPPPPAKGGARPGSTVRAFTAGKREGRAHRGSTPIALAPSPGTLPPEDRFAVSTLPMARPLRSPVPAEPLPVLPVTSHWTNGSRATRRLMVSLACVLGVFGACLAFDYVYSARGAAGTRQSTLAAMLDEVRSAVERGDEKAVASALAGLAPAQSSDARVLALREQMEARRHVLARGELQELARTPALEPISPHLPTAQAPSPEGPARVADTLVVAPLPTPPLGTCADALVALSLCTP